MDVKQPLNFRNYQSLGPLRQQHSPPRLIPCSIGQTQHSPPRSVPCSIGQTQHSPPRSIPCSIGQTPILLIDHHDHCPSPPVAPMPDSWTLATYATETEEEENKTTRTGRSDIGLLESACTKNRYCLCMCGHRSKEREIERVLSLSLSPSLSLARSLSPLPSQNTVYPLIHSLSLSLSVCLSVSLSLKSGLSSPCASIRQCIIVETEDHAAYRLPDQNMLIAGTVVAQWLDVCIR